MIDFNDEFESYYSENSNNQNWSDNKEYENEFIDVTHINDEESFDEVDYLDQTINQTVHSESFDLHNKIVDDKHDYDEIQKAIGKVTVTNKSGDLQNNIAFDKHDSDKIQLIVQGVLENDESVGSKNKSAVDKVDYDKIQLIVEGAVKQAMINFQHAIFKKLDMLASSLIVQTQTITIPVDKLMQNEKIQLRLPCKTMEELKSIQFDLANDANLRCDLVSFYNCLQLFKLNIKRCKINLLN